MSDPFVAMVLRVPEDLFSDDDELCLAACRFVCTRLESHLVQHGHQIADWIQGGCDEDWGVYFESQCGGQTFDYAIAFFGAPTGEPQNMLILQYHLKTPFFRRLFKGQESLGVDHHLHRTMQQLAREFSSSRMLTQSQFDSES
jgi:hypothetical protein